MFLYSLLKYADNAVLKLMSAVIAIAQVLSVSIMLLEFSLGRLKYDSTNLPKSGSLGSLPDSASRSPDSFAILNIF